MKKLRIPLRAVLYKEGEYWIAHCLELDLLGHGDSPPESLQMLSQAIAAQLVTCQQNKAFDCFFSPARPKFFQMFAAGTDITKGSLEIPAPVNDDDVTIQQIEALPVLGARSRIRENAGIRPVADTTPHSHECGYGTRAAAPKNGRAQIEAREYIDDNENCGVELVDA